MKIVKSLLCAAILAAAADVSAAEPKPPLPTWPWPGPTPPEQRETMLKRTFVFRVTPNDLKEMEKLVPDKPQAAPSKPRKLLCWGRLWTHMANLCALLAHAHPGDEVLLDPESHIFYYEVGALASIAGLMPRPVDSPGGRMCPDALKAASRGRDLHFPIPRLVCLENTHNRAGGRVMNLARMRELCGIAHEKGLLVHLDGARIFNAAIACGVPAA